MIKQILLSITCVLLIISPGVGQKNISGRVVGEADNQPVPYANIGIRNTETGTISDEDGTFSINIPAMYQDRELIFSSIGFEKKSILVSSLADGEKLKIVLDERVKKLNEVVISGERVERQSHQFGNGRSLLLSGQLYSDTVSAGSAMALLVDKSQYPDLTFVRKVSLYIAKNKFPSFKVRLRFLKSDNNKPGTDILDEQIIAISDIKKGWLDFTLPAACQIGEDSFYVMFEWILEKKDREYIAGKYAEYMRLYPDRVSYDTVVLEGKKLTVPKVSTVVAGTVFGTTHSKGDLENYRCFYRTNSFGEWKRSTGILSARIEMTSYPPEPATDTLAAPCEDPDPDCRINAWAEEFRGQHSMPGLQIAVSRKGRTIFSKGYGYAGVGAKALVTDSTQFRIASVSKTMTAAALAKLYAENSINLDTVIQAYVPSFPEKGYQITPKQLAGHLGGIKDYDGKSLDEIFIMEHYNNCTDATALFKDEPLAAQPGTSFLYSSYGYILLGAAIENISSHSFLEYMSANIWRPLGMNATFGDIRDSTMASKSRFYYLNGREAKPYDLSYSYPTGGLLSTCNDLLKFGNALLLQEGFLDEASKTLLFTSQQTVSGQMTGYGMGWYVGQDANKEKVWYHAGELPSSGAMLLIYPEHEIVIAVLANSPILSDTEDGFSEEIQQLAEIVYK